MSKIPLGLFVLATILCPYQAVGQNRVQSQSMPEAEARPAPWPVPPQGIEMRGVSTLLQNPTEPKLGNGTVAQPKDWPASFFGSFQSGGAEFVCTATLVGQRTLLTAAHCVGEQGGIAIKLDGKRYPARCAKPQGAYPANISLDVALCLTDEAVPVQAAERLNLNQGDVHRNMAILLAGFGCTRIKEKADGKFRTGPAFVKQLPGEIQSYSYWLATYSPKERPGAFICPGDSGGAVFREVAGKRDVVAVNSHYDVAGTGISYLTVLSATPVSNFVREWAKRHDQRICGVHADTPGCN